MVYASEEFYHEDLLYLRGRFGYHFTRSLLYMSSFVGGRITNKENEPVSPNDEPNEEDEVRSWSNDRVWQWLQLIVWTAWSYVTDSNDAFNTSSNSNEAVANEAMAIV